MAVTLQFKLSFTQLINSEDVESSIGVSKIIASFLVCLMLSSSVLAGETDSLLHILDKAIAARPQYNKIREAKIDSLKRLSASSTDGAEKYRLYFQIFREYRSYNMDSAMKVAREKKIIAGQSGNPQNVYESEMNISEILGIMGMYKESIDILDKIDKKKLDKAQKTFYFHLHHSLYIRLSEIAVLICTFLFAIELLMIAKFVESASSQ